MERAVVSPDNKAIARRIYDECFNKGNLNAVDELLSGDFVTRTPHPGGLPPGREGFKQTVAALRSAFPDFEVSVEDMIADGDKVVARAVARGTHDGEFMGLPPTGKQVTVSLIDIFRMEDGRLAERWGVFDAMGLTEQLGAIPAGERAPT